MLTVSRGRSYNSQKKFECFGVKLSVGVMLLDMVMLRWLGVFCLLLSQSPSSMHIFENYEHFDLVLSIAVNLAVE